ncbi:hypothetical protein COV61_02210 [Candidatus Micrarchaeota archaeon CG11_big_fil_rev_8_21_14_0_20_47_5]|nr:MAG: hypothetical protein AUJ17_03095 [Candidatus Micrarchaeota archaeon CG1_02_47_40]PIN83755.1 MAG: hypothetical protein COV61_02210 [Candidatus Micrarchaeota archaeon CG11_big_fil_rev_8_21_14_0_20_47_5]
MAEPASISRIFKLLPERERLILRRELAGKRGYFKKAMLLQGKIILLLKKEEAKKTIKHDGTCPPEFNFSKEEWLKIAREAVKELVADGGLRQAILIASRFGFIGELSEQVKLQARKLIADGAPPQSVFKYLEEHGLGEKEYIRAVLAIVISHADKKPKHAKMLAENYLDKRRFPNHPIAELLLGLPELLSSFIISLKIKND